MQLNQSPLLFHPWTMDTLGNNMTDDILVEWINFSDQTPEPHDNSLGEHGYTVVVEKKIKGKPNRVGITSALWMSQQEPKKQFTWFGVRNKMSKKRTGTFFLQAFHRESNLKVIAWMKTDLLYAIPIKGQSEFIKKGNENGS